MHLTSHLKNWGRGLGACAVVFLALSAPAVADSLAKQRADFVAAERALQRGDSASYIPLRQRLQDYPLFPYLELGELRAGLATTSTERVTGRATPEHAGAVFGRLLPPSPAAMSRRNRSSESFSSGTPPYRATACATVSRSHGGVKSTVAP